MKFCDEDGTPLVDGQKWCLWCELPRIHPHLPEPASPISKEGTCTGCGAVGRVTSFSTITNVNEAERSITMRADQFCGRCAATGRSNLQGEAMSLDAEVPLARAARAVRLPLLRQYEGEGHE